MSTADSPSECTNLREDYFECLHHRKEIRRSNSVMEQRAKVINEKAAVLKEKIWKEVLTRVGRLWRKRNDAEDASSPS